MRFPTILLDADDTVFDFPKCEYAALQNAMNKYELLFNDEIYHAFSEINSALWRKLERRCIARPQLRTQRFSELIERYFPDFQQIEALADEYIYQLSQQTYLIDGAYEDLQQVCEAGGLIYIITNGLADVQHNRIEKSGIRQFVQKVYISDEVGTSKPDIAFFRYVLNDIPEKNLNKIIVVGDSLTSDMVGGRNSELFTCLYDPKHLVSMPHPLCDYKIDRISDILRLV